jgi:hypothetical protein
MKTGDNDKEWFARLDKLRDGKIDRKALATVRKIAKSREPLREVFLPDVGLMETVKLIVAESSDNPVFDDLKNLVWAKVHAFDKNFLKELIKAMELVEGSPMGICFAQAANVYCTHGSFVSEHNKAPTAGELLRQIKKNGVAMEERTLRDICKRNKLPLSPSRRGRPYANSEVKKKRLPI